MPGWVPVLREDDVIEECGDALDDRDDFIATCYGQLAAGAEVVLHVDDQEGVCWCDLHFRQHRPFQSEVVCRLRGQLW